MARIVSVAAPTLGRWGLVGVGWVASRAIGIKYARAGELAYTLSLVTPPRVRIVPYHPTNSLIISGAVEQLIDIIKPSIRD
jgi:hypothetical protein